MSKLLISQQRFLFSSLGPEGVVLLSKVTFSPRFCSFQTSKFLFFAAGRPVLNLESMFLELGGREPEALGGQK